MRWNSGRVVIKRSLLRQKVCALKHPQPFAKEFNVTTKLSTLNASLEAAKIAGLSKPEVDLDGPAAAAAALKADLVWRVNYTLGAKDETEVAWARKVNATINKINATKNAFVDKWA